MSNKPKRTAAVIGTPFPTRHCSGDDLVNRLIVLSLLELHRCKYVDQCTRFYCSATPGPAIIFGETILKENEYHPDGTKLICTVPYRRHTDPFNPMWSRRVDDLLRRANKVIQMSECNEREAIRRQNQYMIDRSDQVVVLASDQHETETRRAFQYAIIQGKPVTFINISASTREHFAGSSSL